MKHIKNIKNQCILTNLDVHFNQRIMGLCDFRQSSVSSTWVRPPPPWFFLPPVAGRWALAESWDTIIIQVFIKHKILSIDLFSVHTHMHTHTCTHIHIYAHRQLHIQAYWLSKTYTKFKMWVCRQSSTHTHRLVINTRSLCISGHQHTLTLCKRSSTHTHFV